MKKVCFVRARELEKLVSANISCLTFHRLKSPVWSSLISSLRRREAKLSSGQNQSFVWSISVFLHCSALIKIDWLLIRNESTQIFCNETLFHSFTAILALFKKCKKYEKNKKLKAHIKYLKMITLKYWHVDIWMNPLKIRKSDLMFSSHGGWGNFPDHSVCLPGVDKKIGALCYTRGIHRSIHQEYTMYIDASTDWGHIIYEAYKAYFIW